MNYYLKCQLLSEGFKHEQLIEEDWEELKKQLADLYAKNEITQRQVQTRLARAGCSYAAHHAQKIADERGRERQAIIDRLEKEKQKKAMRAAAEAQAAKHQTRGSAAAEYNSEASRAAWLKAANEYRERKEKERQNLAHSFTKAWNNHEVGNIVKAKVVKEELMEEANLIVEASEDFSRFEKKVKKIEKRLQNETLGGHYTQEEIEVFRNKIAAVKKLLNASNKNEEWEDKMTDAADDFNRAVKKASGGRVVSFLFLPLGWIPPIGRAYSKAIRKVTGTTLKEDVNYFPY